MKMETVDASGTSVNTHQTIVKATGKISAFSPHRELLYNPAPFRNIKLYVLLTVIHFLTHAEMYIGLTTGKSRRISWQARDIFLPSASRPSLRPTLHLGNGDRGPILTA
jgi:hypothetical protein